MGRNTLFIVMMSLIKKSYTWARVAAYYYRREFPVTGNLGRECSHKQMAVTRVM